MEEPERVWIESLQRAMQVLNEFDPAALGPGEPNEPPQDEYASEASTLMTRLAVFDELTGQEVRELFSEQFGGLDVRNNCRPARLPTGSRRFTLTCTARVNFRHTEEGAVSGDASSFVAVGSCRSS